MGKQSFLKGAFILLIGNILVKFLGFIYQIMIIRLISAEGIGIFNMVFPLYVTTLVLTTMGLPPAIAKFVAAEMAANKSLQAEKILGTALSLLLIFASIFSLLIIFFAPAIIRTLYADPRVLPSFLFLLPALLLVSISSAIKSYFQGLQDMRPTAFCQIIEQITRISCGLLLIYFLHPYGLTWSAAGLSLAVLLSELAGLIYLVKLYQRTYHTSLLKKPSLAVIKRLFSFSLPVTITRIVSSSVLAIESGLIPRQLRLAGYSLSRATSFYGELSGVAFTILTIPSTLTLSLSTTLVPTISEVQSKKEQKLLSIRTAEAIGITLIAGIPCGLIFFFWGSLITTMVFKVSQAGELLSILSLGSVFLYLLQTGAGILQGLGYVKIIFVTTLIGGMIKLAGIYFGGSHPLLGPSCIAFSYIVSYLIVSLIYLTIIKFKTHFSLQQGFFLRVFLAGLVLCYALTLFSDLAAQHVLYLILLCVCSVFFFFFLLFLTGDQYIRLISQQLILKIKKDLT